MLVGLNVNIQQLWNDAEGGNGINGVGNVSVSLYPLQTLLGFIMIVTMIVRDEKSAADEYPICKSAQIHPGK